MKGDRMIDTIYKSIYKSKFVAIVYFKFFGTFSFAKWLKKNLKKWYLKDRVFEIQGNKMLLDECDTMYLAQQQTHEPHLTEYIKREIKESDIVLDIGANIGYYTLIFAGLVGKNGKVFSFEPDPKNYFLLEKNVEINGYQSVILTRKAVSDSNGKIRLYLCEDDNSGDHRIYNSHDGRKSIETETVQLDDYFKDFFGRIDFIKIDIQGAEGLAFRGMFDILDKNRNLKIAAEFWPFGLRMCGTEPINLLESLLMRGFKIYSIVAGGGIEPLGINKLLKECTIENRKHADILLMRED
jgi:FkbM family methyltransferase